MAGNWPGWLIEWDGPPPQARQQNTIDEARASLRAVVYDFPQTPSVKLLGLLLNKSPSEPTLPSYFLADAWANSDLGLALREGDG